MTVPERSFVLEIARRDVSDLKLLLSKAQKREVGRLR